MTFENLIVEPVGEVAPVGSVVRFTINRPKALNALDAATLAELQAAFERVAGDPMARVVILTGGGEKAFVAGADIKGMAAMTREQAEGFAAVGHKIADTIARMPQIVIAAVNGFALGGGCELTLACDFAYASEGAKFSQPEVSLGVIPGFGGTTRLPRRVGPAMALELVTTGNTIGAAEALRIGLVNRVIPAAELLPAAVAAAQAIVKKSPTAVAAAKRSVRAAAEVPLQEQNRLEVRLFGECFAGDDQKEGMRAFLEKRSPQFTGR